MISETFPPAWTDARVQQLRTLWGEGLSASQIAGRFGDITRNAVIGKVHRLGLAPRATISRLKTGRRSRQPLKHLPPKPRPNRNAEALAELAALRAIPDPVPATAVTFADLEPHHCRWPYGDPRRGLKFCGCQKVEGISYCAKHAARAFSSPSPARIPLNEIAAKAEKAMEAAE